MGRRPQSVCIAAACEGKITVFVLQALQQCAQTGGDALHCAVGLYDLYCHNLIMVCLKFGMDCIHWQCFVCAQMGI